MDRIQQFCERWDVEQFALFGSVLRDDFRPDSDIDVLVSFAPGVRHGMFDVIRMEDELRDLLGRPVDLLTRRGVEVSHNRVLRDGILGSAEVIYAR